MVTKKKLTPASICSQKKWSDLPVSRKNQLRKTLKDTDKDGVPNKYDCHPKNKRKQEAFLPADKAFLESGHPIEIGKYIASGKVGEVYEVKGRRHLVVKTPMDYNLVSDGRYHTQGEVDRVDRSNKQIEIEADDCERFQTDIQPLLAPSKVVKFKHSNAFGYAGEREYIGIVRPRVAPVLDYAKDPTDAALQRLTDQQIEVLRHKVMELSYKGFLIEDGLQIGFDIANRLLLYDMGCVHRVVATEKEVRKIFANNNGEWKYFLVKVGKVKPTASGYARGLAKYGEINFDEYSKLRNVSSANRRRSSSNNRRVS